MTALKKYLTWWTLLIIPEIIMLKLFSDSPIADEGTVLGAGVFSLMIPVSIFWGWFRQKWKSKPGKIVLGTVQGIFALCVIYAVILSGLMIKAIYTAPEDPKLMIVPGCQTDGNKPSPMLERRLIEAKEALEKYPEAKCILSGGKGSGEWLTEAECMKNYLTANGIDESRLIIEDKSTSTETDLENSLKLTDERDITIITSGCHEFRASLAARRAGAEKVCSIPAATDLDYLPSAWVREWLGITYMLISG